MFTRLALKKQAFVVDPRHIARRLSDAGADPIRRLQAIGDVVVSRAGDTVSIEVSTCLDNLDGATARSASAVLTWRTEEQPADRASVTATDPAITAEGRPALTAASVTPYLRAAMVHVHELDGLPRDGESFVYTFLGP